MKHGQNDNPMNKSFDYRIRANRMSGKAFFGCALWSFSSVKIHQKLNYFWPNFPQKWAYWRSNLEWCSIFADTVSFMMIAQKL